MAITQAVGENGLPFNVYMISAGKYSIMHLRRTPSRTVSECTLGLARQT